MYRCEAFVAALVIYAALKKQLGVLEQPGLSPRRFECRDGVEE
jgi:hypothetical protein